MWDDCWQQWDETCAGTVRWGKGHKPLDIHTWQDKVDMVPFLDFLLGRSVRRTAVEIGLGHGGTHMLWKQMFRRVVTVDVEWRAQMAFLAGLKDRNGSFMVCSRSSDAAAVKEVGALVDEAVDLLFIDGDHSYESVKADWELYMPMLVQGGVVAMHDTRSFDGPRRLSKELERSGIWMARFEKGSNGIAYSVKR